MNESAEGIDQLVWRNAEESVAVRSIRRDAMDQIKQLEKDSDISEDDKYKAEDELQKVTDAAIKDVDEIAKEKEKEIMAV